MGLPSNVPLWNGNSPNGSILVGEGKETNRDSLISSERNGKSPNRIPWETCGRCRVMDLDSSKLAKLKWSEKACHRG